MDTLKEFLISFQPGQSGYQFMWILAGIALLALAVIVERFVMLNVRTNVDGAALFQRLSRMVEARNYDEAYRLCAAGNRRMLTRVLGAAIKRVQTVPELVRSAMEEESLHMIPLMEKRLAMIVTCGNIATLLGLMGTIYGLILAFAAVAQPHVSPVEKSSLLATGISAAMNTTLLGLIIAVPCVLVYAIFRARIDDSIAEVDRYGASLLKILLPGDVVQKSYKVSGKRVTEEVDTEPNIVPFMNLMVVLIPLLLSSSEFVKIGMIELKLPESAQEGGGGGGGAAAGNADAKLDLGVAITDKGFTLYHYFKPENTTQAAEGGAAVDIPKKNGAYDYEKLNSDLAEVKRRTLLEIVRAVNAQTPAGATLLQLDKYYRKNDFSAVTAFEDHESIKIVAEEKIRYQVVVEVMDAARGIRSGEFTATMFPNVSLAGGIVQ